MMWYHNVRSYVMHPTPRVKDLRTGVETSDLQGVLDGDIDQFLKPALEFGFWPKLPKEGCATPD